jgi:DNA polymerase/3'-5' exonuclease PolX
MFPDSFARGIAELFVNDIKDTCEQIEIVGSLRRQKYAVNDIDIIVIPKFIQEDDETLFGEPVQTNLLDRRLSQFCFKGTLSLEANGPKIKRFIKSVDGEDVPIDIYISNKDTWWTLMLIRTGSKNHNIMLAKRAIEMHMQLKADGTGLLSPGGSIIPIGSEEHIFEHLNLPYRIPEDRD